MYETERLWERTGDAVRDSIRGADGGPPGKLTLATMAASQCGGRLLNNLSPYHFLDGDADSTLTLHGSIGAGSVRTVDIGGSTDQVRGCTALSGRPRRAVGSRTMQGPTEQPNKLEMFVKYQRFGPFAVICKGEKAPGMSRKVQLYV